MDIYTGLHRLGLSEQQARIYMLLVRGSGLRIQQIAGSLAIARSSVYEHLRELISLSLVEETTEDTHKLFRALPVSFLQHGLQEKITHLEKQKSSLDELEQAIEHSLRSPVAKPVVLRHFKGLGGARQLLWNTLKAKDTVFVYSAYGRSKFVGKEFYRSFVEQSKMKKIHEKVLINPSERVINLIKKDSGTDLARTDQDTVRCLDEKAVTILGETFIYNNIYAQVYLDNEEISGFEIENMQFTESQRSIFETLWSDAKLLADLPDFY